MKILRVSTIPLSLNLFYRGFFRELSEEGFEVIALSSPGLDLEELREREKVKTIGIPMERRISPFKDIISLFRLIKTISKEKPEIIHSITPKAGLLSMLAGWICRVPHRIHTFTGLVFPTSKGLKRGLLMMTDALTCGFATNVHAEGKGVKRDLQIHKITKKNIEILNNGSIKGVDMEYFDPELVELKNKTNKIADKSKYTFIFIGRVGADKGLNELVESFSKINQENPSSRLWLLGWMENELDRLKPTVLKEIDDNPSIEYKGVISDIRPWLNAADCLVLPSYREGFPNVVLEAGAMGKPCIVTDINGSNEIIEDCITGKIVEPQNAIALATAMKNIMSDPDKAKTMGLNARQRIKKLYEQKSVRKAIKDYYFSLKNV